jgi:hypothetical protein
VYARVAWTHWHVNLEDKSASPLIRSNVERMHAALQCVGFDVICVSTESFIKTFLREEDNELAQKLRLLMPQHASDYIRLWLLREFGGLWLDAGIVVNAPDVLEDLVKTCEAEEADLGIFVNTEWSEEYGGDDYENFCMFAPKASCVVTTWIQEYERALVVGANSYANEARKLQVRMNPKRFDPYFSAYVALHMSLQVLLRESHIHIVSRAAQDSLYKLQAACQWNDDCMRTAFRRQDTQDVSLIKLSGNTRHLFPLQPAFRPLSCGTGSEFFSSTADVTAVITACGRPDLLERTLESLFATIDEPLRALIVVEDSGTDCNAHLKVRFPMISWLQNGSNIGQIKSIDAAYALVTTPFVFHCEDDWLFLRTGFLKRSKAILDAHAFVFAVMLRGTGDPYFVDPVPLADGTCLTLAWTSGNYATSFSFNPGLRRMSDYKAIGGSYSSLVTFRPECAGESEWDLAVLHQALGFRLAHADSAAFVEHIGDDRHVDLSSTHKVVKRNCPLQQPNRGETFVSMRKRLNFGMQRERAKVPHPNPMQSLSFPPGSEAHVKPEAVVVSDSNASLRGLSLLLLVGIVLLAFGVLSWLSEKEKRKTASSE